jgi:orotidine-5'-phosphate decarboxylase
MKSAHPTMKGIMRAARTASGVEGGAGLAAAADSADMSEGCNESLTIVTPGIRPP